MVTPPGPNEDFAAIAWREQILDAARAAIEEYGPEALTGQIAARAGLARPNVYRHFASKQDLDLAIARSAYQELLGAIRDRLDLSGTPLDVIRAPIAAQVTWAHRHPNLYRFLVSRGYQRKSQQRTTARHDFTAEVAAAGARYFPRFGQNRDAADAVVTALGGLMDASILRWLDRRTESRKRLVDRLTGYAWAIIDDYLRDLDVLVDPTLPLPKANQADR